MIPLTTFLQQLLQRKHRAQVLLREGTANSILSMRASRQAVLQYCPLAALPRSANQDIIYTSDRMSLWSVLLEGAKGECAFNNFVALCFTLIAAASHHSVSEKEAVSLRH